MKKKSDMQGDLRTELNCKPNVNGAKIEVVGKDPGLTFTSYMTHHVDKVVAGVDAFKWDFEFRDNKARIVVR